MFNSPRQGGQRYNNTGLGGSYVDENPLAGASIYDSFDPWSNAPSPSQTPAPPNVAPAAAAPTSSTQSMFNNVIADATVPSIYHISFASADPDTNSEISVNALTRVLQTSGLPASTINRIVNLVSSRPRVSKLEFFVGLALVALAQSGKDVSVEQVAALSSQNDLPEPRLDLSALPTSTVSSFPSNNPTEVPNAPAPAYTATDDPWDVRFPPSNDPFSPPPPVVNGLNTSTISGTGLPKDWWKHQEVAQVAILGQQGFILTRYTVYQVVTSRGAVTRRYSEFAYLWDCLYKRYPFRLFPALPPKRMGPDEYFLEQRRRGLARSLSFVLNHPVMKEDGLLNTFLTVPSFEQWRKQATVSLEEESASKRVDRVEEMAIPSDLEEKLGMVRSKIITLIDHYQRICIFAERIIKRREAAAVRTIRSTILPAHIHFPRLSSSISHSSTAYAPSLDVASDTRSVTSTTAESILTTLNPFHFHHADDNQSDLVRLTNTLRAVTEINGECWRGEACELDNGVRAGLEQVAVHTQRHSEIAEHRVRTLLDTTLEGLKRQRDLYVAMKDLFIRHDRFSVDQVERLKKRIDTNSMKMESVKAAAKDSWQDQVETLITSIERDQATIAAQLNRRVFIRACMWHELRVVLHNRENTLLTEVVHRFARDEREFAENVTRNWVSLGEAVESMPYE